MTLSNSQRPSRLIPLLFVAAGITCYDVSWAQVAPTRVLKWNRITKPDFDHYDLYGGTQADFSASALTKINKDDGEGPIYNPVGNTGDLEHPVVAGTSYYRVASVDKAGHAVFSNQVAVLGDTTIDLRVQGTPRLRACAGAQADATHTVTMNFLVQKNGVPMTDPLIFSLENNLGNDKGAAAPVKGYLLDPRLLPDDDRVTTNKMEMAPTPLAAGIASAIKIEVRSGQVISVGDKHPRLVVRWKDPADNIEKEVAVFHLYFGEALGKRRYGIQEFFREGYDEDKGWDFVAEDPTKHVDQVFLKSGEVTAGKLFLKFPEHLYRTTANLGAPTVRMDTDYFASNQPLMAQQGVGSPSRKYQVVAKGTTHSNGIAIPMKDEAQWRPVAGHTLFISVYEVQREALEIIRDNNNAVTEVTREASRILARDLESRDALSQFKYYVLFTDKDGNPVKTDNSGNPVDSTGAPAQSYSQLQYYNRVMGSPDQWTVPRYATYAFPKYIPVQTDGSGVATVYLRAGILAHELSSVSLQAVNQTQWLPKP